MGMCTEAALLEANSKTHPCFSGEAVSFSTCQVPAKFQNRHPVFTLYLLIL